MNDNNQADSAISPPDEMEAFFTRQRANDGIELSLTLPDGTPTKHFIRIRGRDSDAFRRAENEQRRRWLEMAEEADKDKRIEIAEDSRINLLVSLVIGWSFDKSFSPEAVKEFLKEAPQIAQRIDVIANNRSAFFKKSSTLSSTTPASNLS